MKVGVVVLLACQLFLPSTNAAHHEAPNLGATAGNFFSGINVPKKTPRVQAKPTRPIAPNTTPMVQAKPTKPIASVAKNEQNMGVTSMPPVVNSIDVPLEDDKVMTHMHIEDDEVMVPEIEDEVVVNEMEGDEVVVQEMEDDEAMVNEMKTDGSNSPAIIDQQQQENDDRIQEMMNNAYSEFHNHDDDHDHDSRLNMDMDLEQHMEMHHSDDHGSHAHLAILPHLFSDQTGHIEMHDSDQHIKTSPMPRLNANTIVSTKYKPMKIPKGPQNEQPMKYLYKNPTSGYIPKMVMRMGSNVYKPQMNNRHYGTGRKQYSNNGYGNSQSHYYHSLNHL